jgi:hypothetical protein
MTNSGQSGPFILYYVVSLCNIIGNTAVLISLFRLPNRLSCITFLLHFLHFTVLIDGFLTIPFIFKGNSILCEIVENFEAYFSLMNILVVAFLVEAYRAYILSDNETQTRIFRYGTIILFVFPLIVFFGNINGMYNVPPNEFCAAPVHLENTLSLFIYYIWIWAALGFIILRFLATLLTVYRSDPKLAQKFFSSISLYIFASLFCWMTRSVFLLPSQADSADDGDDNLGYNSIYFACYGPIQAAGILFWMIYLKERRGIRLFQSYNSFISGATNGDEGFLFTWDEIVNNDNFYPRSTEMTGASASVVGSTENPLIRFSRSFAIRDTTASSPGSHKSTNNGLANP